MDHQKLTSSRLAMAFITPCTFRFLAENPSSDGQFILFFCLARCGFRCFFPNFDSFGLPWPQAIAKGTKAWPFTKACTWQPSWYILDNRNTDLLTSKGFNMLAMMLLAWYHVKWISSRKIGDSGRLNSWMDSVILAIQSCGHRSSCGTPTDSASLRSTSFWYWPEQYRAKYNCLAFDSEAERGANSGEIETSSENQTSGT